MVKPKMSLQSHLKKLNIDQLNAMQEEASLAITNASNTVLLSPTGSGKTLAFLLPILSFLKTVINSIQVLILVPTRELAIQIEQIIRRLGTGNKINAVYGGRPFLKDISELQHPPSILIGTPGRIADHLNRQTFTVKAIKTLILDEFDKSLEIGFENEMKTIVSLLPHIEKRILTSATHDIEIPSFLGVKDELVINYLNLIPTKLKIRRVISPLKNKLQTLLGLLCHIGNKSGIIFCNYKDSINYVSDFLQKNNINHGCFHGGLDQIDRERSLMKFRNRTHHIIVATDLASRGIDVSSLDFIIHYQWPLKLNEFTHRNGRTARMNSEGTAYIIQWEKEKLPEFINVPNILKLVKGPLPTSNLWKTLFISGGRKDKISKGDIVGLFIKKGSLEKNELGIIELKNDCAFVAVKASLASDLIKKISPIKLKNKKVKITLI